MKKKYLKYAGLIFALLLIPAIIYGAFEIPGGWDNFSRALRVIPSGTSTAPSIAFQAEPTLGFYRSGSGVISLAGGTLNTLGGTYLLSDADVAHGMTDITATTNYGLLTSISGTIGGLDLYGISDATQATGAFRATGILGNADPTDTHPAVIFRGGKKNGTTWQALGAAETVFQLLNYTTELFTQTGDGSYRQPASTYHNFGATIGTSGYGLRDNAGTLQFKNSGGAWADLVSAVSAGGWQDDGGIVRLITGADNVGMGGATAGGTNLAGGLVWGTGTAPTTYPANASQFWMADEGSRGGYSHPHFANEAGQNGAIAFQAPLVNLLSNSGFGSWSNGTLENVGSDLVTNGGFGSDAAGWTGTNATLASVAGGQAGNALEMTRAGAAPHAWQLLSLTVGKIYKWTVYVKSGTMGNVAFNVGVLLNNGSAWVSQVSNTSSGAWVQYSAIFEATETNHKFRAEEPGGTVGTILFDTITLYEVTPGTVAADVLGPDGGFVKSTTLDLYREHNGANVANGAFYALKIISGNANDSTYWPNIYNKQEFYSRFAGKTITLGAYVKTDTASHARLEIYTNNGSVAQTSYHTGGNAFEWLEVSYVVPSNITEFYILFRAAVNTATLYISQPMLVFGPSIGAGNYAPSPNETIYTEKVIALTDYTATTSAADATINLEAQSNGFIPKGVKAVLVKAYGKDSAAGDGVGFDVQSASGVEDGISLDTQVNNIRIQGQGWVKTDANGDIYFDHRGSGASALTVDLKVIAVQP